jgi:hypothetical protein
LPKELLPGIERLTGGRRRWIDALLVGTGLLLLAGSPRFGEGLLALAVPLIALGLLTPILRWSGRDRGVAGALALVPPEVAESHRALRTAASLPGVVDGSVVDRAADDSLLEVAALLGGRPPRGAAQRRFVAARIKAMDDTVTELEQRHEAWVAACAEVDALAPSTPLAAPSETRGGPLVGLLVLLLLPVFLAWDLLRALTDAFLAVLDGVALRVRTACRLIVRLASGVGRLVMGARTVWTVARDDLVEAMAEAHHRVSAARVRLRLQLRRARRAVPGAGLG